MKKPACLFTLALLITFSTLCRASTPHNVSFAQKTYNRFTNIWLKMPQEKAYLQTDKPYYSASEDIWFKGYVVNATTHVPNTMSRFLYVELVDKTDSVWQRVKLKKDSLGFSGNFKLKADMPSGYYALRAYTWWMQNAGADFIFSKPMYIANPIDDQVSSQIEYGKPANGQIPITISLKNSSQSPMVGRNIAVTNSWSVSKTKRLKTITNSAGKITLFLPVNSAGQNKKTIDISISEPDLKYKRKFFVPNLTEDFDVQFFPESGILLENNLQTVAFKAIKSNGLSAEITGRIFTKDDNEITNFASTNKGMGKFILGTSPGEHYYALVKSASGVEKRFELPEVQSKGVVLHLTAHKGKFLYEVVNRSGLPDESLYLLIHSRGRVFAMEPLQHTIGQVMEESLPTGIISFSIVDSTSRVLCERLAFAWSEKSIAVNVSSNKAVYKKRDKVDLAISVRDGSGKPVSGNLSMSVTDNLSVKNDTINDHILSYLLLSSDLKGHIEEPASYFRNNNISTRENLDNLLLTQGWTRFNTEDVVKGKNTKPAYYLEIGQVISGSVKNLFGKPSQGCDIIALSTQSKLSMTKTNELGVFNIDGIDFADSTTFILKAKKRKSLTDVEIIADEDIFPKFSNYIPDNPASETQVVPTEYYKQSKEKYYTEGGIRIFNLNEVVVTGKKEKDPSESNYFSGMADEERSAEQLSNYQTMSLMTYLSTISGVQVSGESIRIRGSNDNPLLLIDGIQTDDINTISLLNVSDVESISVYKGASASIFGMQGGNGAIAITLKKGAKEGFNRPISVTTVTPLGYQKPNAFYVPKYDVDSVMNNKTADLRTTIYWNPKIATDTAGVANVNFFTADKPNNYTITIEGITSEGAIFRYVGSLRREDN